MDRQTALLIALAALAAAGLVVSVTGWMHFARDRKMAGEGEGEDDGGDAASDGEANGPEAGDDDAGTGGPSGDGDQSGDGGGGD